MVSFIKYLSSLCVILMMAFNQAYAYTPYEENVFCSVTKNLSFLEHENLGRINCDKDFIHTHLTSLRGKGFQDLFALMIENEEDWEECRSNFTNNNNYFTSTSYTQTTKHFFHSVKKILPSYSYYTNSSSPWYILFQVFRI